MAKQGNLRAKLRLDNVTSQLLLHQMYSWARRLVRPKPDFQVILAIIGCQRSGTSVMSRMFFRDLDCVVYREKSSLTGGPEGLRYLPFSEVARRVSRKNASLIVFKMLVESQRSVEFLNTIPSAKAIWLFRNYRDVANSNLNKFGENNGIRDIEHFLQPREEDWRSQGCSAETVKTIRDLYTRDMSPSDAAALFWYARNKLFFEQELDSNPRVLPVEYESYVTTPTAVARQVYDFTGLPYPGDKLTREISVRSVSKGRQLELSPTVEALCEDLLHKLQQATISP